MKQNATFLLIFENKLLYSHYNQVWLSFIFFFYLLWIYKILTFCGGETTWTTTQHKHWDQNLSQCCWKTIILEFELRKLMTDGMNTFTSVGLIASPPFISFSSAMNTTDLNQQLWDAYLQIVGADKNSQNSQELSDEVMEDFLDDVNAERSMSHC